MPIYTYECEKCGKQFEVVQRITDEPLKLHGKIVPEKGIDFKGEWCNGKIRRIITGCNFILKGSGWNKPRTKSQKKVDEAIKRLGIEDASEGYEVGE